GPPARSRRGRARRASAHGGRYSYRRAAAPRRAPSRVQSPAPLGAAPEPRREGGLVARLERPLQLAQRLFERAQSREQFVTVHEKNLGPEGGLGGCEVGAGAGLAHAEAEDELAADDTREDLALLLLGSVSEERR